MKMKNNNFGKVRAYISNQKQSDRDIRHMFINRPLEPYLHFLMAWADFAPIFTELEKEYKTILDEVLESLNNSLQLVKFAKNAEDDGVIHLRGISITDEDNMNALVFTAREQIILNYQQIFEISRCNTAYEDMVNEFLAEITETLLKEPVVNYKDSFKRLSGGLIMEDCNYDEMLSRVETHIKGIQRIAKSLDYGYVTEVISVLHSQSAVFNNQLFRDIYDFCDVYGYIPEEQRHLHDLNSRPTAKSDYVRAAYNRLRSSGRFEKGQITK